MVASYDERRGPVADPAARARGTQTSRRSHPGRTRECARDLVQRGPPAPGRAAAAGLVISHKDHGHTGRPAERYRATTLAEPLFATTADRLPIELLEHMAAEEPELVGRVFDRRCRQMVDDAASRVHGQAVDQRVAIVTELLDEQGYLADFEAVSDDQFRINLRNCAIWGVANRYPQACAAELDYLRALIPDASVQRVTHKTNGAHTCAYEIHFDAAE